MAEENPAEEIQEIGKILILKASKEICKHEMGSMEHYSGLIGMKVYKEELKDENSLKEIVDKFKGQGITFEFVYLCAHGSKEGFGADLGAKDIFIEWSTFGQLVCESAILNDDTIFLLACCQGGLFQVATDIMAVCNKINYVCGVKWTVQNWDLTTGFIVFLHNLINKQAEPAYAAQKASLATDYTFVCNDRDEIESTPQFLDRQYKLWLKLGWINVAGNTITQDEKILENTDLPDPVIEPKVTMTDIAVGEKIEGIRQN